MTKKRNTANKTRVFRASEENTHWVSLKWRMCSSCNNKHMYNVTNITYCIHCILRSFLVYSVSCINGKKATYSVILFNVHLTRPIKPIHVHVYNENFGQVTYIVSMYVICPRFSLPSRFEDFSYKNIHTC